MKLENGKRTMKFKKYDRVLYVPIHVQGDLKHKDCEYGAVSSVNEDYVFVKFDPKHMRVRYNGDEDITAQCCDPKDLIPSIFL